MGGYEFSCLLPTTRQHAATQAASAVGRDAGTVRSNSFDKIAWILSGMPKLEEVRIAH